MFGKLAFNTKSPASRGFGLVELLVSISIVAIVMAIVMVKNSAFSSAVVLRNQAFDVAFALRQAQQLAVSGNVAAVSQIQEYGIHAVVGSTSVLVFRNVDAYTDDFFYDAGDITIDVIKLDPGFVVRDIVTSTGGNISGTVLSVTFRRPDFDATFRHQASGGAVTGPINIEISPVGATGDTLDQVRWVEVTGTGQISVKPHIDA